MVLGIVDATQIIFSTGEEKPNIAKREDASSEVAKEQNFPKRDTPKFPKRLWKDGPGAAHETQPLYDIHEKNDKVCP
jgi:hypothetical protein